MEESVKAAVSKAKRRRNRRRLRRRLEFGEYNNPTFVLLAMAQRRRRFAGFGVVHPQWGDMEGRIMFSS
jgi:hypothetical protein